MAGHSHAKNVQHRKDKVNAKKAKAFSKVAKMITVAAKLGGGDPDGNPRLRLAMDKGRMVSMPKDNVERAIKKGIGGTDLGDYEDLLYEGYGPGGVAIMIEILTDNRKRTAPEVRTIFDKRGGNLGTTGSVAWMFERKAAFLVAESCELDEDQLTDITLEAGGEDLVAVDNGFEIRCDSSDYNVVEEALKTAGVPVEGGEVRFIASNTTDVDDLDKARKVLALIDAIEEQDDVQSVYSNHVFPSDVTKALAAEES